MTLIIAIACSNGVVMAADSATTDVETGTKQPSSKILQLGDEKIIYGASGDTGLFQKIQDALSGFKQKADLRNTRSGLQQRIVPVLKTAQDMWVPKREPPFKRPPESIVLFAGIDQEKKPWILEIERDGRDTSYDDDLGSFAAIGSGKPWAQAIFRPHLRADRNLEQGKVLAYRVVFDAVELAAHYLALPVQMYVIPDDSIEPEEVPRPEEVPKKEIDRLREICDLWREIERESLGKALAPLTIEEVEPEPPEPEESAEQ